MAGEHDGRSASPAARLREMTAGYNVPQVLYVAAALGLADLLVDGPLDGSALARATGADPLALCRLLRTLAALGVLQALEPEAPGDGRYALTPLGACLRVDGPDSQRAWVLTMGNLAYRIWGELLHSVRTGEPGTARALGSPWYDYLATHPEAAAVWDGMMVDSAREWLTPLAAADAFANAGTLVDVGGGHGAFLAAVLRAHPELRGTLFDLPHVVAGAPPLLAAAGVDDRCTIVGGDMFRAVPAGDTYCFTRVLFNWPDEAVVRVLGHCARALPPGGAVLLVERLLPAGLPTPGQALNDLGLLVSIGGRHRTEAEFRELLAAAGLQVVAITRVRADHLLTAIRAPDAA